MIHEYANNSVHKQPMNNDHDKKKSTFLCFLDMIKLAFVTLNGFYARLLPKKYHGTFMVTVQNMSKKNCLSATIREYVSHSARIQLINNDYRT